MLRQHRVLAGAVDRIAVDRCSGRRIDDFGGEPDAAADLGDGRQHSARAPSRSAISEPTVRSTAVCSGSRSMRLSASAHLKVGQHVDVARLLEADAECGLQRVVEHLVVGEVLEIADDDEVAARERDRRRGTRADRRAARRPARRARALRCRSIDRPAPDRRLRGAPCSSTAAASAARCPPRRLRTPATGSGTPLKR